MNAWKFLKVVLASVWLTGATLFASPAPEEFDGSFRLFRLETAEVITGGYFVENAQGRFLYMDTEGLAKGGLFERISESVLRSVIRAGAVEIEFLRDADEGVNGLVWKEGRVNPLRGKRIYPHHSRLIRSTSADGTQSVSPVTSCSGGGIVLLT